MSRIAIRLQVMIAVVYTFHSVISVDDNITILRDSSSTVAADQLLFIILFAFVIPL